MNAATPSEVTKDKLIADFKTVVVDAEELLRATANQTGERVTAVRARVEETLRNAKEKLADVEQHAVERAKAAAKATDKLVHDHPWQAVGIAVAVGYLIGAYKNRH